MVTAADISKLINTVMEHPTEPVYLYVHPERWQQMIKAMQVWARRHIRKAARRLMMRASHLKGRAK